MSNIMKQADNKKSEVEPQQPLPASKEIQNIYPIPEVIVRLAEKYNVTVDKAKEYGINHGCCGGRSISLGLFEDSSLELLAFFHELGHIKIAEMMSANGRTHKMCTLSNEGAAWEIGLCLAADEGYQYDFHSDELTWARKQLQTYIKDNGTITSEKDNDRL